MGGWGTVPAAVSAAGVTIVFQAALVAGALLCLALTVYETWDERR